MAIQRIAIEEFLSLSKQHPVFDVRSPSEFSRAHIPHAYSLPLFDDEQRKIVGTAYKQQSREQAIKIGLEYFGTRMPKIVEEAEQLIKASSNSPAANTHVLVHCWRGGMRSGAIAWLLDLYGYKVYTLAGGYKAFRNWVLKQFNNTCTFKVLGGYTGSGKTVLLHELARLHYPVIDLEKIAGHKGSAFGDLGEEPQPSQEMFENRLALEISHIKSSSQENDGEVWLEDESQRIGQVILPAGIWQQMRASPVHFIDIPFEERLNNIHLTYGKFALHQLEDGIRRIQKKLGGLETKKAIEYLNNNNTRACFSILLRYYDKCYIKGLYNRKNAEYLLNKISCRTVTNSNVNTLPLLQNTFK